MSTVHQLLTADEFWHLPDDGMRHELIRGEVHTMPPSGGEHGFIGMNLAAPLTQHVKSNQLGVVLGAETGFGIARNPDTVRAPGIAFVRQERIPATGIPRSFWPGAPDLVVEVISPRDTLIAVEEKVDDWLTAGARLVWVVNPRCRTVSVYRSPTDVTILTSADELDGNHVIPGFRCRVAEIFG
ncbi:MAG: Uma2 family endonuclease [Gemmataceae bacterium]